MVLLSQEGVKRACSGGYEEGVVLLTREGAKSLVGSGGCEERVVLLSQEGVKRVCSGGYEEGVVLLSQEGVKSLVGSGGCEESCWLRRV